MTRAALYLRQSMDRDGRSEGIDRQRAECRKRASERGWTVVEEYVDNDVSASKPRGAGTAWHRLIADAKSGNVDVVVATNQDRILRGIRDLVTILDTGVKVATVDGELDLTTADGEFRATLAAGLARFEVRRKSERQRRANSHRRQSLLPAGGARAFGYTKLAAGASATWPKRTATDGSEWPDYGHEPLEPEAAAVRQGFATLLAGGTLRSIARGWNGDGHTTTAGRAFSAYSVRVVLSNPRYAALVAPPRPSGATSTTHNLALADLPVGSWEPLVSPETWAAARDLLMDPTRRAKQGAMPKTLLSGIATCGICGAPVKAGATMTGVPTYRCSVSAHLSRKREDADHFITHVILDRLSQPDAQAILRRPDTPNTDHLRAGLLEAKAGEANVLALVGQGLTSIEAATGTLRDVRERIARLEAALTDAGRVNVLGVLVDSAEGAGDDYDARWSAVNEAWAGLDSDRQRAVVRKLMSLVMQAPGRGARPPRDPAGRLAHTEATLTLTWL